MAPHEQNTSGLEFSTDMGRSASQLKQELQVAPRAEVRAEAGCEKICNIWSPEEVGGVGLSLGIRQLNKTDEQSGEAHRLMPRTGVRHYCLSDVLLLMHLVVEDWTRRKMASISKLPPRTPP